MRKLKIAKMFINVNFIKSFSAIIALTTFLLVLNILLGILFSSTGMFSDSVTENSSMHFMEIINEGELSDNTKINDELSNMFGVNGSFIDVSHPIQIQCKNESGAQLYTLIGVPNSVLSEFNLSSSSDKFLFLPKTDENYFTGIDTVEFEETLYLANKDGLKLPELKLFKYDITGFYNKISLDIFPENLAIIDEATAMEIARGMTEDGTLMHSDRVIANVTDVSKMKSIEDTIVEKFPNTKVRYPLKYTGKLPQFATVLIAISGIILAILFIFCFINIKSSVKQMLNIRQRDIGLLSLFGVKSKEILWIFVIEFIFNGLISFLLASAVTCILFLIFKYAFLIDLITNYFYIYLITNAIIAVIMFVLIAIIQVRTSLKKINNAKIFKEILK